MNRRKKQVLGSALLLSLGLVAASVVVLHVRQEPTEQLDASIRAKISFVLYTPADKTYQIDQEATYYDSSSAVLHIRLATPDQGFTMTEQATPPVFDDVPEYFTTLLSRLNKYASLHTPNGTVYLTKPSELKGQQQALLNNNGTLVFVHPDHSLTNQQWQTFFAQLQPVESGKD